MWKTFTTVVENLFHNCGKKETLGSFQKNYALDAKNHTKKNKFDAVICVFLPGKGQVVNQEVYNIFARSCCYCEKKDEWRAAFFAMYASIKMYADFY